MISDTRRGISRNRRRLLRRVPISLEAVALIASSEQEPKPDHEADALNERKEKERDQAAQPPGKCAASNDSQFGGLQPVPVAIDPGQCGTPECQPGAKAPDAHLHGDLEDGSFDMVRSAGFDESQGTFGLDQAHPNTLRMADQVPDCIG